MYGLALLYREMTISERIQFNLKKSLDAPNLLVFLQKLKEEKEVPKPITDSNKEYNIKPRFIKCENCHYEIETSIPGPKCGICHSYLIVVFKNA